MSPRAKALGYSAVKLFSKNSNLCDHHTWTSHSDGRTDGQTDRRTDNIRSQYRAMHIVHRAVKTLIKELQLLHFYLFNMRPKLHHWKWRKLCVTLFRTFSSSSTVCWCCSSSNLYPNKLHSIATFTFMQIFDPNLVFFTERRQVDKQCDAYFFKICVIFSVWFKQEKVDKKQTCTKTEAYKLYSRVFWIFLPNVSKIDQCNFEL